MTHPQKWNPTAEQSAAFQSALQLPAQPSDPRQALLGTADYLTGGAYQTDTQVFEQQWLRTTGSGYKNLDAYQRLYPGLYVLGAISSLGKTTFMHQMADQLATAGEAVLYFSLEQSRFELTAKSLARQSWYLYQAQKVPGALTSLEMRLPAPPTSSPYSRHLTTQPAIAAYAAAVENRMLIVEGDMGMTVEDIERFVDLYVQTFHVAPVVVIDYLQIVAPSLVNGRVLDTKTAVDHTVYRLKCLQRKYGLLLMLISSLNRQNYMTAIDYESFKESGGIEYTADVMWGLQLQIIHDDLFTKGEGQVTKKREAIRAAKAANPRLIELVNLKNRYGASGYTCNYKYYPDRDLFECD